MKPKIREVIFMLVTGVKRIGKSNETIRDLCFRYSVGASARKVLIYDPNNEYGAYEAHLRNGKTIVIKVKRLGHDDILLFNKQKPIEIRRIVPIDEFGEPLDDQQQEELIIKCMKQFRGGCLFIEDMNSIFGDTLPKAVSGFFTNNAHRDADIIMQVQSIGRIVPKMIQNINVVRFHHQLDSVDKSQHKLLDEYEIFKIAQLLVDYEYDNGNKRFFVYLDRDDKKIRGEFTKKMFIRAIEEYIYENPRIVKRMTERRELVSGKMTAQFTEQQAVDKIKENLFKKYYGN